MDALAALLLLAGLLAALAYVLPVVHSLIWVPYRLERRLRRQGIGGPPRSLVLGNGAQLGALLHAAKSTPLASFHHAVIDRVAPQYRVWPARYGRPFVFWLGTRARLVVSGPEVAKAVLTDSTGAFDKATIGSNPQARQLIGEGLVGLSGETWAHHRRVIAPAFNMERVKVRERLWSFFFSDNFSIRVET
jgi:hypothetical protein